MHVAGSAWFPYFAFSDFSFQKPQGPHRSTIFLMSDHPPKTALQSFYHPKLYAYPRYLSLKTKAGNALQATVPSSVIA